MSDLPGWSQWNVEPTDAAWDEGFEAGQLLASDASEAIAAICDDGIRVARLRVGDQFYEKKFRDILALLGRREAETR